MDKRYQVFVSSTYEDLQEERQEVMQALLELDCIPAGMELFPAANEDQWTLIKKVIDDCDYYVVIVGGRYGSVGPGGLGYTEMEYRYAEEQGKPIIAFLHPDPDSLPAKKTERTQKRRRMLEHFRSHAKQKMCKHWSSAPELGSVVSRGIIRLIKTTPAVGWVRADEIPDEDLSAENVRLRKQVEELEGEVASFAVRGPEGTDDLAQGDDVHILRFDVSVHDAKTYKRVGIGKMEVPFRLSWNEIMRVTLPPLAVEGSEATVGYRLDQLFEEREGPELLDPGDGPPRGMNVNISRLSRQDVIVQLRALGLITPSVKKRSLKDRDTYWKLTSYGANVMTRLCAVRRENSMGESPNKAMQTDGASRRR